jgi:hypothetical protein
VVDEVEPTSGQLAVDGEDMNVELEPRDAVRPLPRVEAEAVYLGIVEGRPVAEPLDEGLAVDDVHAAIFAEPCARRGAASGASTVRTWKPLDGPGLPRRRCLCGLVPNLKHKRPAIADLLMGDTGLEPVTSCLSSRRSPS